MPAVRSKRICSGRGCRRRLPVPRTSSTPRTGTPKHRALPPTMSRIWLPPSPLSGLGSMPVPSGAVSWGTLPPICLVEVDRLRASPKCGQRSGRGGRTVLRLTGGPWLPGPRSRPEAGARPSMRTPWWPSMRPGRQPLAGRSRDAYLAQMRGFLTWLAGSEHGGAALVEPGVRDRAVRDYKRHVQTARHWAPSTVNQALAVIDSFYRSIGVGRPEVAREELARVAPRALAKADQRRFLRAVEGCPSARDRAIATVFFYTGLRLSELAALE